MQLGQQQLRTQLLKLHTWESEQASFFFPQHRAATKTGEEDVVGTVETSSIAALHDGIAGYCNATFE